MAAAGPSRPISALPGATQSRLRSTQILTSLSQVISELVQNALDAGARQVDIGVDCEEWTCWVRDDGAGIPRDGLALLARGSEAGRYGTSKAYTPVSLEQVSTFGFRGEALASAADLSCLEISSRTARSRESWSVILRGGAELYSGPSVRWRRESPGTVVCVRDAFYNLPVRRRSHTPPLRTIELVRKDLEAFALVFPHVSFSLENTHRTREKDSRRERVMTVPKTSSSIAAFRHLYGRALAEHVDDISETSGEMKLSGFISLEGAYSKTHQYLYINRHLLAPCDLHRAIDAQFNASSFTKHAFDEEGATRLPRSAARRSPRKSEKRPVYVLNLSIPPRDVDNCLEPAKAAVQLQNSDAATAFLTSVVAAFLRRHSFLSQTPAARAHPGPSHDSPRPHKRRKLALQSDRNTQTHSRPSSSRAEQPLPVISHDSDADNTSTPAEVVWADPATGKTFVVDTRTGNSYPAHAQHTPASARRTLAGRNTPRAGAEVPAWIQTALGTNDAYALREPRIRALARPPAPASRAAAGAMREGRLARSDLLQARVLGQVERKFVACVLGGALVLLDQHAADERVRVERFLGGLCDGYLGAGTEGVRMRVLGPPVPVLLTSCEAERTRDGAVRAAFARWGVRFVDGPCGDEGEGCGYEQVMVESVPEVVADKLLVGDELRELVKGYLVKLESEGTVALATQTGEIGGGQDHMWQKALRWCPRELIELVNSKACRGAIMFNDSLTREQCARLVGQLAETALPFQCAHGRPSLVPLADLGSANACVYESAATTRPVDWARFGVRPAS
ncbi:hypothetical protein B0H21DRAFT_244966 [Amylocystis lapponica]|nr:hypothetical protein B0H21DRAFT_244966 [Amylocystis lapponica]